MLPALQTLKTLSSYFQGRVYWGPVLLGSALNKILIALAPLTFRAAVQVFETAHYAYAVWWVAGYGALRLLSTVCGEGRDWLFAPIEQRATRLMAEDVFDHLQKLGLEFHLNRKMGALARSIDRGMKSVETFCRLCVFGLVPIFFELFLVCGLLWIWFPPFFSLILFMTFAAYVAYTFGVTHWRLKLVKRLNELDNTSHFQSLDSLLNYTTVKYFHREDEEKKRYGAFLQDYQKTNLSLKRSLCYLNMGQVFILTAGLVAILVKIVLSHKTLGLGVSEFVMMNVYILQFIMPLHALGYTYREIKQAWVDITEMLGLLRLPPETADEGQAHPLQISKGDIHFESVTFGYHPGQTILNQCTFHVEGHQRVALVGASGAGKTSIINLLLRFFDPQEGRILIDGQETRMLTRQSLRQTIGIVPQDIILFNETLLFNIAYGNPEASAADIEDAARQAHIHELIAQLPQGYQTLVGERGLKLSGGEKQRVAIARALLKKPRIFVFDEATSSLDLATEKEIQRNIREVTQNVTTLIIAHRLSTITDVDRIFVMKQGAVVEQGTHSELLEADGVYAALWNQQQGEDYLHSSSDQRA